MNKALYTIFIIDDDESIRRSVSLVIKSAGYQTQVFAGVEQFLENVNYAGEGCILLDVFLEGKSGLEMLEEIQGRFYNLPIIYFSGMGDIPMSVDAMKKGAINFLQKPLDDNQLLRAIDEALIKSRELITDRVESARAEELISTLTPREDEILRFLLTGMLNKQIAAKLNIAEHTVKLHRGKITEKLGVKSVAELVRIAEKANIK